MMGPGTLGVAAVNINVLVNTYLAAAQDGRGLVARLRVPADVSADRAVRRLDRHGGAARSLAACRTRATSRRFAAACLSAIRLMLMLNVPAMIGLIVLAEPIVALLYQRGHFTDADTPATAAALRFYAPG